MSPLILNTNFIKRYFILGLPWESILSDTTSFITTPEFNRFTKISVDELMKEAANILVSKSEGKNVLTLE